MLYFALAFAVTVKLLSLVTSCAAGMVIAIVGLLVRSRKIRCPYCGELKLINMMDLLKWSAPIRVECPICGKMIEYDE